MWILFTFHFYTHIDLGFLGVYPRDMYGLVGVAFSPLVHGSLEHIIANSFPLLFLGLTLFLFYPKVSRWVFYACYVLTGVLVWIFGRSFYHIGASGVIYGLACFLMFAGFFRKDMKSILISITVVILYGGIFSGIFPTNETTSFESHLFGALIGTALAFFFRNRKSY